jgi:hypothetical protein
MGELANTPNTWIAWTAAALVASLVHVLVDFHIGLYGETSSRVSWVQAANVFFTSFVYGWWIYSAAVAATGDKSALVSALVIAVLWAFLWNGVVGLAVSPPPSSAFPYQDIAHASSILFGAGAGASLWRVTRSIEAEVSWAMPIAAGVVLLLAFVVQSVLGLQNAQ